MPAATHAQKCRYCDEPAVCSIVLWGGEFIPVCEPHDGKAREEVRHLDGSIVDVKKIEPAFPFYGGATMGSPFYTTAAGKMESALQPAPHIEEEPGTHFGQRVDGARHASAFAEAPQAPIGRRDVPRGAVVKTRSGKDVMGVKGKHIARTIRQGRRPQGTSGPARKITTRSGHREEIPDSLLQMLGTDWKTMRAHRVHDNRMTVNVDGVRFTVYTRRG